MNLPELTVIDTGEPFPEAMHHAIDDVMTRMLADGEIGPTLRFWYRQETAVPIGRYQAYADEVHTDYVDDHDIPVVRRSTGGGAMFAEPGNVITYSLYLPEEMVSDDIRQSYADLDAFTVDVLRDLGVEAEHVPLNDIECPDGKLGGAAQLRRDGAVLHHTMLSYDLNIERMLRTLKIGEAKLSDKAIASAEKRVARIADQTGAGRREVIRRLLEEAAGPEPDRTDIDDPIRERARDRVRERFGTTDWNRQL